MPATDEQKAVGSILRLLQSKGESWTRVNGPAATNVVAREAKVKFSPVERTELDRYFFHGDKRGQFRDNQAIYIEPPPKDKSAVAALWCRWNFDVALPRCTFYFGIWSEKPSFPTVDANQGNKHTAFVGFRYETPEEGDNHDYYHAQPCQSMGSQENSILHALPLPQRYPTFPLAAESPLELLLCLVVSLYGVNGLSEMQAQVLGERGMQKNILLRDALKKILSIKRKTEPET